MKAFLEGTAVLVAFTKEDLEWLLKGSTFVIPSANILIGMADAQWNGNRPADWTGLAFGMQEALIRYLSLHGGKTVPIQFGEYTLIVELEQPTDMKTT